MLSGQSDALLIDHEERREHESARPQDSSKFGQEMDDGILEHVSEDGLEDDPIRAPAGEGKFDPRCLEGTGRVVEVAFNVEVLELDVWIAGRDVLSAPRDARTTDVHSQIGASRTEDRSQRNGISADAATDFKDGPPGVDWAVTLVRGQVSSSDAIPGLLTAASELGKIDRDGEALEVERPLRLCRVHAPTVGG
jgi:hypothetical protein